MWSWLPLDGLCYRNFWEDLTFEPKDPAMWRVEKRVFLPRKFQKHKGPGLEVGMSLFPVQWETCGRFSAKWDRIWAVFLKDPTVQTHRMHNTESGPNALNYRLLGTMRCLHRGDSLVAQPVKNLPAMKETRVWSLGWEDPLEEGMATHSSILAWEIPWTEEPGALQPMESRRVGHDWATNTQRLINYSKCNI